MCPLFDGPSVVQTRPNKVLFDAQSVLLDSEESDAVELELPESSFVLVSSLREPGMAVEDFERLSVT